MTRPRRLHRLVLLAVVAAPCAAAAAPHAGVVVLFQPWRDPTEGAFTANVPEGWAVTGGTTRRSGMDVRHHLRATSPGGGIRIFFGDPALLPSQHLNPGMMAVGLREGQLLPSPAGGQVRVARYQTGAEFARQYAAARVCRAPAKGEARALEKETRELQAAVEAYGRAIRQPAQATVGEATFRCGDDTVRVAAATILIGPPGGAQAWDVLLLGGYATSDPSTDRLARYVLDTMAASLKMDPQWQRRQAQVLHDTTGAAMRAQARMTESLAQRSREQRSSQFDVMSSWVERNKRLDAAAERASDARRGTTTVSDPVLGERTVGNTFDYWWTRPDGSLAGTNTSAPPDDASGWRQMTPR